MTITITSPASVIAPATATRHCLAREKSFTLQSEVPAFKAMQEQILKGQEKLEEVFGTMRSRKVLGMAGPLLLCSTFMDDGLRVVLRWSEQIQYMTVVMKMNRFLGVVLLVVSAIIQLLGSALVLRAQSFKPSRVKPACYALLAFVAAQPFMYGQVGKDFMCRSVTLAGGLLLLIWSENDKQRRRSDIGLPQGLQGADRLQLAGRLLLTFLFFFQALWSENGGLHKVFVRPRFLDVASALLLLGLAGFVCAGFKTQQSAMLLAAVLGTSNVYMYPFWSVHERLRDFYRYYFFQTLSIIGGLMLLALHGPGGLSVDKGRKSI